jgi:hypothetical protein
LGERRTAHPQPQTDANRDLPLKNRRFLAFVVLLSLLIAACGSPGRSPASPATTLPASDASPSYEALVKGEFVNPSIPRITAEDLKQRLDRGDKLILIDTRADWKFEMGHLPGAINIHYAIDSPYPGAEEAMDKELSALPNDVLKVLYCN